MLWRRLKIEKAEKTGNNYTDEGEVMNVKVLSTEYATIKKRFQNGDKISDIASDYDVSVQTIRIILRNKCHLKLAQRQGNNRKIQSKNHSRIV